MIQQDLQTVIYHTHILHNEPKVLYHLEAPLVPSCSGDTVSIVIMAPSSIGIDIGRAKLP